MKAIQYFSLPFFCIQLATLLSPPMVSAAATGFVEHCNQYHGKGLIEELLPQLAKKLSYSLEEFCNNPRIADIYHEQKSVYHDEDDTFHTHEFITLHYWEYSCEYQYDIDTKNWADQHCYSTL